MWLNFLTQYNLSYLMFVPNFKSLGKVVPEKSLTKISISINFHIHYIGVKEKGKIEKESKNKSQHLGFVYSNTLGWPHCVYKI